MCPITCAPSRATRQRSGTCAFAARRASTRSGSCECSPNASRWTWRIAAKSFGDSGRTCNSGRRSPATLDSMAIEERIKADLSTAAKAQDRPRVSALRLLIDSLQKEAKQSLGELDEQGEIAVLKRERKRRAEAAAAYRKGGRADAAAAEEAEAELIDAYLPAQISDDELQALVADAWAETGGQSQEEMGRVMSAVMSKARGRADGRRISELVKERLSG